MSKCVQVGLFVCMCGCLCVQVGPYVILHGHAWLCLLDLGFELCSCLTLGSVGDLWIDYVTYPVIAKLGKYYKNIQMLYACLTMCKLGYTWQLMITGDHCNQEVTKIREIIIGNRKYCYTIKGGWISQGQSCGPKMKVDSSHDGKSSKQKYTNIFKGNLVLLGTSPRPKMKGEGRWTGPNRRLPPTSQREPSRGKRGRCSIELWWWGDGSNPGHEVTRINIIS